MDETPIGERPPTCAIHSRFRIQLSRVRTADGEAIDQRLTGRQFAFCGWFDAGSAGNDRIRPKFFQR